jgi:hypothetical protein
LGVKAKSFLPVTAWHGRSGNDALLDPIDSTKHNNPPLL